MWSSEDIEDFEAGTDYCEECGERDDLEAMVTVLVATPTWHRVEKFVHAQCRDFFVASNLPAVLASLRGVPL